MGGTVLVGDSDRDDGPGRVRGPVGARVGWLLAAVVLVAGVAVPVGASATTVIPNVDISRAPGNQVEGAVAIDPTNPLRVFAVSNSFLNRRPQGLFAGVSADGGATWAGRIMATGTDGLTHACCDPSVSWDRFGNLFLVYLDDINRTATAHVLLSTDGGNTFTQISTLGAGSAEQPTVTTGAGTVWVTWSDVALGHLIEASGARVTGRGVVGAFTGPLPVPGAGNGNFGDIAIGPMGQVMVTWQSPQDGVGPSEIYTSTDPGGLHSPAFGPAVAVTPTNVGGSYPIPAQALRTIDAEAGLAWDRSRGAHRDRVYLVYTNSPAVGSADTEIFMRMSDDGGITWSRPVRVDDDTTGRSKFLPRVALDRTTGKLAVSWYDARRDDGMHGPGDTDGIPDDDAQFWGTTSDNGRVFAPNFQISAGTSNAADSHTVLEYGDYTGLAYFAGTFYPVWADNSDSTGDNPGGALGSFDLYTAAVVVQRRATALAAAVSSSPSGGLAAVSAVLTDRARGTAVPGATVEFKVRSQSCTAITDDVGRASCTIGAGGSPGRLTVQAVFAGDEQYSPSHDEASTVPVPSRFAALDAADG